MESETVVLNFILEPRNLIIGFGALVLMFLLFGREDKYDEIDHAIAASKGYELPRGDTKGASPANALWVASLLAVGPCLIAGFMLSPLFYGAAAVALLILVWSTIHYWNATQRKLHRAGLQGGGRTGGCGFLATIVGLAVFAAVGAIVAMVLFGW